MRQRMCCQRSCLSRQARPTCSWRQTDLGGITQTDVLCTLLAELKAVDKGGSCSGIAAAATGMVRAGLIAICPKGLVVWYALTYMPGCNLNLLDWNTPRLFALITAVYQYRRGSPAQQSTAVHQV